MGNRILMHDIPEMGTEPPVQWEETPCPHCGRSEHRVLLEAQDANPASGPGLTFAVCQCQACGLRYTNPRPDLESITGFYPADYRPHRNSSKAKAAPRGWSAWFRGKCPERRGQIAWHGRGRLLDFGCGGGSFLQRMALRGWTATGLDMSPQAVETVERDLGLQAFVGTLPHPDLRPCSFDVITMWHSLEHVHEPLETLREAYRLLAPDGQLIVACPNADGWPARWFGPHWFGLDLPRHLTHFTQKSLREMLCAAGFIVERERFVRHSDWLRSSAKLAARRGFTSPWQSALCSKPIAKLVAWVAHWFGKSDCIMTVARRPG